VSERYDWSRPRRELLEEFAGESVTYWRTPGPGPKPLSTGVIRALDALCKAARVLRTGAEVDAEIGVLSRELAALPIPYDLEQVGRLRGRINELCRERTAEASPPELAGAVLAAGAACESCRDLRGRLRNIYHLTTTYSNAGALAALRAIREASGPGAPAPPACGLPACELHCWCGVSLEDEDA
jgi:hypothetical protein